jgi:hypothetical protein
MPFIDTNLTQSWTSSIISSQQGINRISNNIGLFYIDNTVTGGCTYSQGKNYQLITKIFGSNPIGDGINIRFRAPFRDSVAAVTRDVDATLGVEFYTYAAPLSTLQSNSIVRYGATENFTASVIVSSTLNDIDFLVNGYKEYSDLSLNLDDQSQPANGWYFNYNSNSYNWFYNSSNIIGPSYSTFGSGLDTPLYKNYIAKAITYDIFALELNYETLFYDYQTNDSVNFYLVRTDLLQYPGAWGLPIVSFTASTTVGGFNYVTNSLIGTNNDGSKNYLVISASQSSGTPFLPKLSDISIYGAYHPDNNRLQLTTTSTYYSDPTSLQVLMNNATYSYTLTQNGTPYILSSRIGNGLFRLGIWENGVWNNGWRDDEEARDFDDVSFSVLTESDISWKVEIRGSTYSIGNFKMGDAVSIGNIIAIDINDNRKLLKDYYKIENLGIGYNYSVTGETQSAYGWLRVNLDTPFPWRRIEKDSQNHKIKVTKNIWLSGGFFNGYFSGVWNNGLFKGYPLITEMFNTYWIDGFFNGGHFNSVYSDIYTFSGLDPRQACTNGYINLTFEGQYTSFLPGDYILITLSNGLGIDNSYGGVAQIIAVDHQIDPISGDIRDVITIDKIFNGGTINVPTSGTILGSVIRYTATGLIQNFKFYDNNRSRIKSIDNSISTAVFSFNSWIDVNYDDTRSVTLGRDFRMYEPLTKKSINRNNLYGYPTYDILSSVSRFRDSNTLDYKLYKLGTKYKVFTNFIGEGAGFNEPFNELDFSNFSNAGWTSSYYDVNNFTLKRTETLISLDNTNSVALLNSGVTGDELYVTASNTGLILNNNNISLDKSRYSIVEFDVITYSVADYNFSYKNPDIYQERSFDSSGTFSETIGSGTIISGYNISGALNQTIDDIIVSVDIYGEVSSAIINLRAPNGKIINVKRNGSGIGIRMTKTKFSLRDIFTKFSNVTTPYSLSNNTMAYFDTYLMDTEIGQGNTPFQSDSTLISDLTTVINGSWDLYIEFNTSAPVVFDLINWSLSLQYRELISIDTEPVSTFPILNFSNLNYDITTQLSGYDNVQVYKKMNYLPIRSNINHLLSKNSFRLDSIEETRPTKWGGFGENRITKKYEYFYNKTDMMLSINGNGATGGSQSMVVLDNINMYEVDMIPFFKYFDEPNIYKGIQIPYIGDAPNIDYLNSDFVFIDNITVGIDAIEDTGNNTFTTNCQTVVVTTDTLFIDASVDSTTNVLSVSGTSLTVNAGVSGTLILDNTSISWTVISNNTLSPVIITAGNTLNPIISGLVPGGTYVLQVTCNSDAILSPAPSQPGGIVTATDTVTIVCTGQLSGGPTITIGNPNKNKSITYSLVLELPKDFTYSELTSGYSSSAGSMASIKILSLTNIGDLSKDAGITYSNLSINDYITSAELVQGRMNYFPLENPGLAIPPSDNYNTSFTYVIVDTAGNLSPVITFTLFCTLVNDIFGPSPSPSTSPSNSNPSPSDPRDPGYIQYQG